MKRTLVVALGLALATSVHAQPVLTVGSFLREVRLHHEGLQAAQINRGGVLQAANRSKLIDSAQAFINAEGFIDGKVSVFSALQGGQSEGANTSVGIFSKMDNGLEAKLSYRWNVQHLPNAAKINDYQLPSVIFDSGASLLLTQSLWRNGGGAEVKATKEQIEAGAQVEALANTLTIKQILVEAEAAYWRLLASKEIVAIQEKSLDRAKRMVDWVNQRSSLLLADNSDVYQAKAALELRTLELRAAIDEDSANERAFANYRGQTQLVQARNLPSLSEMLEVQVVASENKVYQVREAVQLAQKQAKLKAAQVTLETQQLQPDFNLYLGVDLNQFGTRWQDSFLNSFAIDHPTIKGGFMLSFSLDAPDAKASLAGLDRQKDAAEALASRKGFEDRREWIDLKEKLAAGLRRIELARKIEKLQKEKYENEVVRHQRGRSTTYQVLLFQQDYANAQLTRITTQAQVAAVFGQLRTFKGR